MRILVIGAGAVGGYFGGRLAAAGRDVTFLVRPARAEQLRRDGLRIVSPCGDLTLAVKTVLAGEIDGPYDMILFGVKAFALEAAMEDFAPAAGPETMILPLLNGMRHLDVLAARFGKNAVLGGSTRISSDLDKDGRILHLGTLQDFAFGELDGSIRPRMKALEATLNDSGFEPKLTDEIIRIMWQKWVMLSSLASITCLLRGNIGAVAATPQGVATAHGIVDECAAIADAEGHPMSESAMKGTHARLTEQGSDLAASMYRDVQKGAPVEVEHIIGDLLGRGSSHGIDTPLLRATYAQLSIYQARLQA